MKPFKFGHAGHTHWQKAARSCLKQMGPLDYEDNLGFLYVTDLLVGELPTILAYFKQHTGITHWVGTVGIGICSQAKEYLDVPAIAVMIGNFLPHTFEVFSTVTKGFEEFSRTHQAWCSMKKPMFAIVHGDPRHDEIADLIFQLSERLGETFLVGGLISSRSDYLQIADDILEEGLSGVMFTSDVLVTTRLTQGCTLIGPRHQITAAQQNIIIRIDDRPALDVFNDDIGEVLARDLNKVAGYIFAALPIMGSDTGDYLVRNLLGVDPEHRLLAVGESIQVGMPIRFARRDPQAAHEDLVNILNVLKQEIKEPLKGGVYFSCLGRGENMFGQNSQELKTIQAVLGNFPLVGFFANGEISHQRLYSYTGVLTLFF